MNKRVFLAGFLILSVAVAVVHGQQASAPGSPQATIVRSVNLVDVLFSVATKNGKLITDLNRGDFKVFDDGAQQEITAFSQPTDLPLRIGIVLDTSNSIRERLKFEQDAAIDFLFNALRRGRDQAFLMSVDNGAEIIKDFTGDFGVLRDVILKQRAGGGTALYDSVYAASEQLLSKSPLPTGPDTDVRRVLVVISDGDDNSSSRSRGEAVESSQRAGVIIYSISTNTQWMSSGGEPGDFANRSQQTKYFKGEGDRVLEQLAQETGGRVFFPSREDELGQAFLDIGDELRHQYALAYSPQGRIQDGKFHTIRIQVSRKDVSVRARRGYYSLPKPPASGTSSNP